jgi:hypothetical protein
LRLTHNGIEITFAAKNSATQKAPRALENMASVGGQKRSVDDAPTRSPRGIHREPSVIVGPCSPEMIRRRQPPRGYVTF